MSRYKRYTMGDGAGVYVIDFPVTEQRSRFFTGYVENRPPAVENAADVEERRFERENGDKCRVVILSDASYWITLCLDEGCPTLVKQQETRTAPANICVVCGRIANSFWARMCIGYIERPDV